MSQQQRQIRRESAQFRESAELRRRRPIGIEGPLPGPRGPALEDEMSLLGIANIQLSAGDKNEFTYGFVSGFPDPLNRIPVGRAGKLRRLQANVDFNGHTGPMTYTVYKNGVATALVVTYAAAETGLKDFDVDTVSVVKGDRVSLVGDAGAALSSSSTGSASFEFVPD